MEEWNWLLDFDNISQAIREGEQSYFTKGVEIVSENSNVQKIVKKVIRKT